MTPDERQLIADLFENLRASGALDKDREAESFIAQYMRSTPDAAYKLVQSALIQQGQMQEMDGRIQELEAQVQQLQDDLAQAQQAARPSPGTSFLAGRQQAPAPQPMQPPVATRSGGFGQQSVPVAQAASSPWGRQQAPVQQGYTQQPMPMQQQPVQAQGSGGGFFKSALAMAAGVTGGMLAAGAIKDMMGGSSSAHAAGKPDATTTEGASPYEVNAGNQAAEPEYNYQSESDNDPGNSDSGSWGGDDGSAM